MFTLSDVHETEKSQDFVAKYKATVDKKGYTVEFDESDFMWAVLTKIGFLLGSIISLLLGISDHWRSLRKSIPMHAYRPVEASNSYQGV